MAANVRFGGVPIYVDDVSVVLGVAYVRSIEGTLVVLCTPPKDT